MRAGNRKAGAAMGNDDDGDLEGERPSLRLVKGGGRPRKSEAPRFPAEEVDRLLVFGEAVMDPRTGLEHLEYPTHRELAKRFNVSHGAISNYAAKHNCVQRRKDAEEKTKKKVDAQITTMRAKRKVLSVTDAITIIDDYAFQFQTALAQGRVRIDNPADLNVMLRLRAFLQGDADSRQELNGALSLEALTARHRETMETSPIPAAVRGEIGEGDTNETEDTDSNDTKNAPGDDGV